MTKSSKPRIFVSSTVYGYEELLDQIYALLNTLGYEVWMSHKGTVPIDPKKGAMDCCVDAVDECEFFLGIIFPRYGSGRKTSAEKSVTHREFERAVKLKKPRWVLAHDRVVFARQLLHSLGHTSAKKRSELKFKRSDALDDLRVIDILELVYQDNIDNIGDRKGNWAQTFKTESDANLFVLSQFRHFSDALQTIRENFKETPNSPQRKA